MSQTKAIGLVAALALLMQSGVSAQGPRWSPVTQEPAGSAGCLQARIELKRSAIFNGTPIITATLFLRNCWDVASPFVIAAAVEHMTFAVVDASGNVVPREGPTPSYSGGVISPFDIVLPRGAELSFPISGAGAGVFPDRAGLMQFGPRHVFTFQSSERPLFLRAVLDVPRSDARAGNLVTWFGRIELPEVEIPLKPVPIDPAEVTRQLKDFAATLSKGDEREITASLDALSLIDDDRVVPLYVQMVETRSYTLKFRALDRLARLKGDAAFSGIRRGMLTQGADLANMDNAEVATQSAVNIRHAAAIALGRSPHPDALKVLRTMAGDPSIAVRLTVVQAIARDAAPESRQLLDAMTRDADLRVRDEAIRLLEARQ